MKSFIGTKAVNAKPMNRLEYNNFRGWKLPDDENGEDEGYLVEYVDGGAANTKEFSGYVSWSPKEQFENAYRASGSMSFGHALTLAEAGAKIARRGWNGAGQFVVVMGALYLPPFNTQGTDRKVNDRTAKWIGEDTPLDSQPYFALKNAQNKWQPGWVPSQGDLFAKDWMIAE